MNEEKLQNFYKNAKDLNPKFTMDYEAFKTNMQDSEKRSNFYDNIRKLNSSFTMTNEEADTVLGFEIEQPTESKKRNGYQSMIDSHTSFAAAHLDKLQKEQEEANLKEQEYQNLGLSEQDKKDKAELGVMNTGVTMDANGIFHIKDYITKNEYGMPTGIKPIDPLRENIEEYRKSQMSSYVQRGEDDYWSIVLNTMERARNTEEGKNLWESMLNEKKAEFKQSDEYKQLVLDLATGKATEQQIAEVFAKNYGEQLTQEYFNTITNDKDGIMRRYFQKANEQLGAKVASKESSALEDEIDIALEEAKKVENDDFRERYYKMFRVYPEEDKMSTLRKTALSKSGNVTTNEQETSKRTLYAAKHFNEDSQRLITAVVEGKGFGDAFTENITDIDTWDLGINKLIDNAELLKAVKKLDAKEELTKEEQLLVESALNYFATTTYYSDKLGRGYKAGQTTAVSLPFMIQFMLSSGVMSSIDTALKGSVKGSANVIVKGLLNYAQKHAAAKVAGKAGLAITSSLIGAGMMTTVWGIPKVVGGSYERQVGYLNPEFDETGRGFKYGGRIGAQSALEATYNSLADNYIENLSEMVLAKTFQPISAYVQGSKLFKGIKKSDLIRVLSTIRNRPYMKTIREKAMFGGLFEEAMEEELGGLLRLAAMTDVNLVQGAKGLDKLKEAGLDMDGQIDIFLGLAPTSLFFSGTSAAGYYGKLAINSAKVRKALKSETEREMFDKLMEESNSGAFGELAHDLIRDILLDSKMKVADKRTALLAIGEKYRDVISDELNNTTEEVEIKDYERQVDNSIEKSRYRKSDEIYTTRTATGDRVVIVDGNVVFTDTQIGNNTFRVIDTSTSDAKIKIRKQLPNGQYGEIEEIRSAALVNPIYTQKAEGLKQFQMTWGEAELKNEEVFTWGDEVYDTKTGKYLGTKEEYEKQKEEEKQEETPAGAPVVDTKKHGFHNTVPLTIDGKKVNVKFDIIDMVQNEDGSINVDKSGRFAIKVGQSFIRGEEQKEYIEALSEQLKQEHAQAVEAFNSQQEAQRVEPTPLVSEEDIAVARTELEQRTKEEEKQQILAGRKKDKNGELDMDKLTPEETVLTYMQEEPESLEVLLQEQLQFMRAQITAIQQDSKLAPIEKKNKARKFERSIAAYETAIDKWMGQEALSRINAVPVVEDVVEEQVVEQPIANVPVAETEEVIDEVIEEPAVEPVVEQTITEETVEEPTIAEQPNEEVNVSVEEPKREAVDLSSNDIVFVRQRDRVSIARMNEDGTLTFVDNGKKVGDSWMVMPNKIMAYYNGQPCYLLTTVKDVKELGNYVNIASIDYIGNKLKVSRWDLTDAAGNKLLKTGSEIQEERIREQYKSMDDFLNAVVYVDAKNGVRLTLGELLAIPSVRTNIGKRGRPTFNFQVEQFIISQEQNRNAEDVRRDIKKNISDIIADWNAYVRIHNLTNVVTEDVMTEFYKEMKEAGDYKSNGLIIQTQDFDALNSADVTKNPILQLLIMMDQAKDLKKMTFRVNMSSVDKLSSIKTSEMPVSELTDEQIETSIKEIELDRAKKHDNSIGLNRYNALMREKERRANPKNATESKAPNSKGQAKDKTSKGKKKEESIITDKFVDSFVKLSVKANNSAVEGLSRGIAKNALSAQLDKLSPEDVLELYKKLITERSKSQGAMVDDINQAMNDVLAHQNASLVIEEQKKAEALQKALLEQVAKEETNANELTDEQRAELQAEKDNLSEQLYDAETDEEIENINKRIAEINSILNGEIASESKSGLKEESIKNIQEELSKLDAELKDAQEWNDGVREQYTRDRIAEAQKKLDRLQNTEFRMGQENAQPLTEADGLSLAAALQSANGMVQMTTEEEARAKYEQQKSANSVRLMLQMLEQGTKGQSSQPISGAKLQKNLESTKQKYQKSGISSENAITDIAKALGAKNTGTSNYITIEAANGQVVTLRISNHNATISNFDNNNENNGISIVISRHANEGIQGNGNAHIVEFFYSDKKLNNSLGTPIADIIESLEQTLYSGEYKDKTGLAQVQEVNAPETSSADYSISSKPERREFFKDGDVILGYAEDGKIYLTPAGMNANTVIHEYTHIWAKALQQQNPKAWKSIVDTLKKCTELWNEVLNDKNYESIWGDENAIASEVLSRYSGKRGAERLRQDAERVVTDKKGMEKGIKVNALINRVRQALEKFWSWVGKNLFEIEKFDSIEEIADRALYDLLNQTDLSNTNNTEREQIVAEAKANGTYMQAPNGQPTKLTEQQWVDVRTQAFKDYFGDWQNDPANASVVLDENGEPLVVYHGSRMAGFDKFGRGVARDSQGIYTTDNRRAAESYATSVEEWKSEQTMPEAELGVPDQHGVYSLYVNMRNPKVIDFGGKRYDEYGETKYEVATNEALDNGERGILFDTLEEVEAYIAEHPEEDLDYVEKRTTSDDLLVEAKEEGYDGVIFTNIIDSRYPDPITNYVPFEANQVKSATQNIGTFNAEDDHIQFMVGGIEENNPLSIDADVARRMHIKAQKQLEKLANPNTSIPDALGGDMIAEWFDRTEGIRRMMNMINQWREEHGLNKMGEGFNVRLMIETMDSKINNQIKSFDNNEVNRLQDIVYIFVKVIEKSNIYKEYKTEKERDREGKPVVLTPVEFLERYLIVCDSIEREALSRNPRGVADFERRMGIGMIEFYEKFVDEIASTEEGKEMINELWDSVRAVTSISIKVGHESGLISDEDYENYSKRRFYVPERDFAEVEANEELWLNDSSEGRNRAGAKRGGKLLATQKAEGGETLAANVLTNMIYLTYDAIRKAEHNKVKVAMFDLLTANQEWCREKRVPIPVKVWYEKDATGKRVRRTSEPSAEAKEEMRRLKSDIRHLESLILDEKDKILEYEHLKSKRQSELNRAINAEDRKLLEYEISELEGLILSSTNAIESYEDMIDIYEASMPYVDNFEAKSILFESEERKKRETVIAFIDGVPCEMHFPNMLTISDALNGVTRYESWNMQNVKMVTSAVSSIQTVYDPRFFTVNITRDIPYILTKGFVEYGFTFPFRFIAKLGMTLFTSSVWKAVASKGYSGRYAEHMREFYEGGGNTGFTQLPEVQAIKRSVAKWGKKKVLSWGDILNWMSFMNEWSEVWTRSAAYSVVRDMGYNNEEGIHAAKNLSVNFNRKGLGSRFMNLFSSFSMFANAVVQGACGFYRAFSPTEGTRWERTRHIFRAIFAMGLAPAFAGFITTLCNPDDDDDLYSDYERDNNAIFGDIRIPLNEQLKPFWVIGVNIALGMQGKRNGKDIARSIINSLVLNLVPLPNSVTSAGNMILDSVLGYNGYGTAKVLDNLLTPQVLKATNGIAANSNFMGSKFRYDAGDIPEYKMSENEAYMYRGIAELIYKWEGGDEYLDSKTVRTVDKNGNVEYKTLKETRDVNPKQLEAWASIFLPSGIRDGLNVVFVTGGKIAGDEDAEFKINEYNSVSRFYKPQDQELNRYFRIKEAREYVYPYQEHLKNIKAIAEGSGINNDEEKKKAAKIRLEELNGDFYAKALSKLVESYNKVSSEKIAKRYRLDDEGLRGNIDEESLKNLDEKRDELLVKIEMLMREKNEEEVYIVDKTPPFRRNPKYTEQEKQEILGEEHYRGVKANKKNDMD